MKKTGISWIDKANEKTQRIFNAPVVLMDKFNNQLLEALDVNATENGIEVRHDYDDTMNELYGIIDLLQNHSITPEEAIKRVEGLHITDKAAYKQELDTIYSLL